MDDLIHQCEQLTLFPKMGVSRDDIRPGLRFLTYKNRVVIAYSYLFDVITILDIYYAGRDFEQYRGTR